MTPPIFEIVKAAGAVTALIGSNPVRFYGWGEAPQDVQTPYCVWQTIFGSPFNYLGQIPDADSWTTQVDVYADSGALARQVAAAIRDALQTEANIENWGGEDRNPTTKRYRYSFDVAWITPR